MAKVNKWTEDELRVAVKGYIKMQLLDKDDELTTKVSHYKQMEKDCPTRTAKSFEYRMMNISHVFELMGLDYIKGLRPAANVGAQVIKQLKEIINQEFDTYERGD